MQSESERATAEEEREPPPKKSRVYVLLKVLFCVIKHRFCGSSPLTSSAPTIKPVRLIPLLTGEAQVAAQQLPVANLLAYEDLKRAILQRVGRNPEQHRQRFRSVELGDCGRPFVMAQQLRDACRKWLLAEPRDVEGGIDLMVLEKFIARLSRRTAE